MHCDRTMRDPVLLSLARNDIHAMETTTPLPNRLLTMRVRPGPLGVDTEFRATLAVPRQTESGETPVPTLAARS